MKKELQLRDDIVKPCDLKNQDLQKVKFKKSI